MPPLGSPFIDCPHCGATGDLVRPVGGRRYECACCAKVFELPPPAAPPAPRKGNRLSL